jgi:hypothetical protein
MNQPEIITAKPIHVWVRNCDACSSSQHRLNSVATFAQNISTRLCRKIMWGDNHAIML